MARPCRSRRPHRSSAGSPLNGDVGQVAPSGWAQWPRLQLLPPGHGTGSHFALLPKLLQPAPRSPSTPLPRRPLPYLLPGNTWLCGTPKRSFLGAYSLTWDERGTERQGTEACVWASSRPRRPLVRGWQPEGAPRSSRGQAGVRQRQGLPLRYPPLPSSPRRLSTTTALRRPAPSRLVSPAATLSAEPCPRAQSPPPPHIRVRAHTHAPHKRARAHTHTHECGWAQWEPAPLWCNLGAGMVRTPLTDGASFWEELEAQGFGKDVAVWLRRAPEAS